METGKNKRKTVCIYCASGNHIGSLYFEAANELGALLAQNGLHVINGAGNSGLMRAISDAVLEASGTVTGVIPEFMIERGWQHPNLTRLIVTKDIHERKQQMTQLSQGVIALPGGCGTLEELMEIITWKQLGLYPHPIVILNINHYYDPLIEMLNRAIAERFMHPEHATLWTVAETPQEAIKLILTGKHWEGSHNKYK